MKNYYIKRLTDFYTLTVKTLESKNIPYYKVKLKNRCFILTEEKAYVMIYNDLFDYKIIKKYANKFLLNITSFFNNNFIFSHIIVELNEDQEMYLRLIQ